MNPFLVIDETHIDPSLPPASREGYSLREAARAVVTDAEGKIALLHVTRARYYKLPGGGIENDEEPTETLARELQEEIGCNVEVVEGLGTVQEFRYYWNMNQLSYCYLARVVGNKGTPDFTEQERSEGFEIVWAKNINEAIYLLESSATTADPKALNITFMRLRDVAIAEKAKRYL